VNFMEPILIATIEHGAGLAAEAVVSGLWQGLALVLIAALLLRLAPKTAAATRFAVWGGVFVLLALLPALRGLMTRADGAAVAEGARVAVMHVDARWSLAIAAVWVMLSMVRAGGLLVSAVRLRGIWKRATPAPVESGLGGHFAAGPVRYRRAVQLCTSMDVDCPSVIGFFSPRVLIPAELFERLSGPELEQIVLHEMGHLQRGDDWINLLQKIGLVLFPLNPALLWIERRLCFERELACDDAVLRWTKAPKAYATCLTTLAEHRLDRRGLSLSLGAWERRSALSQRVYSILRWKDGMGRTDVPVARMVLGTLVLGLLGGAVEMARCPQLVSFSAPPPVVASEARILPDSGIQGGMQNVVFRPAGEAHETLLKASMPEGQGLPGSGVQRVRRVAMDRERQPVRVRRTNRAVLQRVTADTGRTMQRWIVLTSVTTTMMTTTSWHEGGNDADGARIVLTTSPTQNFSPSYAAVPTVDGWLILQL
jgi:beta-lactamase regulating signal transducer with metallopeptidase domain